MTRAIEWFDIGWQGVLIILAIVIVMPLLGSGAWEAQSESGNAAIGDRSNESYSNNMVLNVYIDDAGKALVTGYAESIDGLPFLEVSQYQYDKDTKQLYALTSSLTYKSGDDWEARLQSLGDYGEYHSVFYMPDSVTISKINSTPGVEYLVSASNQSIVVDLHGYDIKNPDVIIDYRVPLRGGDPDSGSQSNSYLLPGLAILGFGIVLASAFLWLWPGRKHAGEDAALTSADAGLPAQGGTIVDPSGASIGRGQAEVPDILDYEDYTPSEMNSTAQAAEPEDYQPFETVDQFEEENAAAASSRIEITSEMAAVMETLTARERAVITALIGHSGRMTQADIRFETGIPKSSLTGIITSLERRKLIIKKEWGRTNKIELSEWFLSKNKP